MSKIPPLSKNQPAIDFLQSRRSRPPKCLTVPGPDDDTLQAILTIAMRVPDHGKLEPWRIIVISDEARLRIANAVSMLGKHLEIDPVKIEKSSGCFANSPVTVVVVSSPKPSEKIPAIEQTYSAGALCLSLVNSCLAHGFGASWLTAFPAYDPDFATEILDLGETETVAGFIHIGTEKTQPPERPRPNYADKITEIKI